MKLLQNKKIAYLTAIFCTLLWGTAFPFIKVGYSAFEIEESDIGSKLIFAGMRFMLAGFMVFLFLWISKRKPPTLSKKDILPVCSLGVVQTGLQYIFTYIGIGFTSGTNTSIITACASFFTVLFVPLFFKNDRLTLMKIIGCILGFGGIIAINFGGTVVRRYDDSLFNNICGGRQHRCEKSHNRTRSVSCNRFSAFNRRFYIACVGHMLRWQYWFDKC